MRDNRPTFRRRTVGVPTDAPTCLACGRTFRNVGLHAFLAHALTADQYRKSYGLARQHSLVCLDTAAKHRDAAMREGHPGTARLRELAGNKVHRDRAGQRGAAVMREGLRPESLLTWGATHPGKRQSEMQRQNNSAARKAEWARLTPEQRSSRLERMQSNNPRVRGA